MFECCHDNLVDKIKSICMVGYIIDEIKKKTDEYFTKKKIENNFEFIHSINRFEFSIVLKHDVYDAYDTKAEYGWKLSSDNWEKYVKVSINRDPLSLNETPVYVYIIYLDRYYHDIVQRENPYKYNALEMTKMLVPEKVYKFLEGYSKELDAVLSDMLKFKDKLNDDYISNFLEGLNK